MIKQIIDSLKNNSSILIKKDIITENKENETFKKVLFLALDVSIVFDIKKLPQYESNEVCTMTLDEALDNLKNIYNRKYTGYAALDYVQNLLESLEQDDAEVLCKVILKDLDCGVQEKIVNAVIPGFIKDEPYMRCSLINTKTIKNITSFKTHGYAVSEIKMDGQYLNNTVVSDSVIHTSRNGKVYNFHNFLDEELKKLNDYIQKNDNRFESGMVVSGEGLAVDSEGKILPRETSNGILQKAGKDTITPQESDDVILVLWDIIPYENYMNREWNVKRKERRELLEKAIEECGLTKVRMIKYRKVKNIKEAFDFNKEAMDDDEEGSILKCEDAIWKAHTSPKQLKMKLKMEFDMKIIGFKEGNKKRAGMLGSIHLQSSCGEITVHVGTGIKEKDAEWTFASIWAKRDELLGKILTIEANGITLQKNTGKMKIYLPVFVEFRFDKNTCDDKKRMFEIQEAAIEVFRASLEEIFEC